MKVPELETRRLLLRAVSETDLEDMYAYTSSPVVGPRAGWKPHGTKLETLQVIRQNLLNNQITWGIVVKETNTFIGTIGFIKDNKRANPRAMMIGYSINEQYWGHGFMTEAVARILQHGFSSLHLEIISAYCYPFNEGSKRVLEKCGFCYEGRIRAAELIYNGKVHDHECYSLTSYEYLAHVN